MFNYYRNVLYSGATGLIGLGFKRGIHSYNYELTKRNKYRDNKETYFYSHAVYHGIFGSISYIIPIFWVMYIPKEIYRLEVNLRNLESEKSTDKYNEII